MYENLLSEGKIGNLTLKNRVVDKVDDEADEFVLDALEEAHRVRIVGIERVAVDARFTAQFRGRDLFDGLAAHQLEKRALERHFCFYDPTICLHMEQPLSNPFFLWISLAQLFIKAYTAWSLSNSLPKKRYGTL